MFNMKFIKECAGEVENEECSYILEIFEEKDLEHRNYSLY